MAHSLFLTHWFPTQENPVNGIFIREHALAIALYHKVTVIHIQGIDRVNPKISREEYGPLTIFRVRYPKPLFPRTGWIYMLSTIHRAFGEISRDLGKPDILHAHVYSSAPAAYFLRQTQNVPAILTEQSSAYPRNLITKNQAILNRFLLNRLDYLMPVSEALAVHMRRYGVHAPYRVVRNTIDTTIFHPGDSQESIRNGGIKLLTVAGLHPIKGHKYLIQAISRTPGRDRITLSVVGDGPERSALEQLTLDLNLQDTIHFLGPRNKLEIANLMRQAQLFVLTSLWDSLPAVLLEALASGLPVLASSVGGIPEIVKPFCGRLVLPGDAGNISYGLANMIDHLPEFPSTRIAEYAESEFSYKVVGRKQSEIYETVIQAYKQKT